MNEERIRALVSKISEIVAKDIDDLWEELVMKPARKKGKK
jgi:hypothetical protein